MSAVPHVIFRADAGSEIGAGHVMRCLALAQAVLERGVGATFVGAVPDGLACRLREEGLGLESTRGAPGSEDDARGTVEVARRLGARHVVIDGYRFGPAMIDALRGAAVRTLAFDDGSDGPALDADILLDQNVHADPAALARRAPRARLLCGTRYASLRREFRLTTRPPHRAHARRLLVTMGGGDHDDATGALLRAVSRRPPQVDDVVVLIGAANRRGEEIEARARAIESPRVRCVRDARDVPRWMAWADLAISGAGSTVWELCYMRVPALLVVLADNQRPIAERMASIGAAIDLGDAKNLVDAEMSAALDSIVRDAAGRKSMAERAERLVDGKGASRVVAALFEEPDRDDEAATSAVHGAGGRG